ncbi:MULTISPECIES: hypothetical protein [unclassified Streptomyces]|uniref:hypothetical protein n=1 Tax=unclassified Streptomyces TaxID=2593676 RepID=UPI0011ADBD8D|nr:hypothetical protein [Streptomyces sp. BK340]TVZ93306.1 hypothetical protein FB157_10626 [Streptomyces sp. BK340]
MPASRPTAQPAEPVAVSAVSMRDLLASCAAADAVSRPPRRPEPEKTDRDGGQGHRRAA